MAVSEWGTAPSVCSQCSGGEDSVGFRCRLHQALLFDSLGNASPPVLAAFCYSYYIAMVRLREVEGDLQEPQIRCERAQVRHVSSASPAYSGCVVLRALIPTQDFHSMPSLTCVPYMTSILIS